MPSSIQRQTRKSPPPSSRQFHLRPFQKLRSEKPSPDPPAHKFRESGRAVHTLQEPSEVSARVSESEGLRSKCAGKGGEEQGEEQILFHHRWLCGDLQVTV